MKCSQFNILSTISAVVLLLSLLPLGFLYGQTESGVIITDEICEDVSFTGFTTGSFLSSSPRTISVGESLLVTGRFTNRTNLTVPDEKVYVVLFSEDSDNLFPVSVQRTSQTLHFTPGEEMTVPVEWVRPEYLGEGTYRAYLYTSQASDIRDVWASVITSARNLRESSEGVPFQLTTSGSQPFSQFVTGVTVNGFDIPTQSGAAEWLFVDNNQIDLAVQIRNNTDTEVLRGQISATLHSDAAPSQSNLIKEQSRELRLLPNQSLTFQFQDTTQELFSAVAIWYQEDGGGEHLLSWIPLTTDQEWQNRQLSLEGSAPRIVGIGLTEESIIGCVQFPLAENDEILFGGHSLNLLINTTDSDSLRYEGQLFAGESFVSSFTQTYGMEIPGLDSTQSYSVDLVLNPLLDFPATIQNQYYSRSLSISYTCEAFASCSPVVEDGHPGKANQQTILVIGMLAVLGLAALLFFLVRRRKIHSI